MKNLFPGHYTPTAQYFQNLGDNATIALDANVLLHLLRLGDTAKIEVLSLLEKYKNRLWIPHQVALEFSRNWNTIEKGNYERLDEAVSKIKSSKESFVSTLNYIKKYISIDSESIISDISSQYDKIINDIEQYKGKLPNKSNIEETVNKICEIFEEKIGDEYIQEELNKIYKEGEARYKELTPPGYKDKTRKKGNDIYGDLILWKQLLKYSKNNKKDIILITEDHKEDWFQIVSGRTIGPQPALINEFKKETGQHCYIYQLASFLQRFNENQETQVSEDTIEEIKAIEDIDDKKELFSSYYQKLFHEAIQSARAHEMKNRTWYAKNLFTKFTDVENLRHTENLSHDEETLVYVSFKDAENQKDSYKFAFEELLNKLTETIEAEISYSNIYSTYEYHCYRINKNLSTDTKEWLKSSLLNGIGVENVSIS